MACGPSAGTHGWEDRALTCQTPRFSGHPLFSPGNIVVPGASLNGDYMVSKMSLNRAAGALAWGGQEENRDERQVGFFLHPR